MEIVLDFETASLADLATVGSDIYSKHITTEVLSLAYAFGNGEPHLWYPGPPVDTHLWHLAEDPSNIWIAFNAGFEKDIWRNIMVPIHGFPDIPNSRWHDIAATCALRTWPLGLDKALATAGLGGKDMAASKLTRSLSKPDKRGALDRSPESLERVYAYNADDVVKERALHKRIGYLPPDERWVWLTSEEINERGVKFDLPMIRGALTIYGEARSPLIEEFRQLTGVNPTQVAKIKDWLSFAGVHMDSLAKEKVNALLGLSEDEDDGDLQADPAGSPGGTMDLPDVVRRALTIRALVGSASVKKFARMEQCADPVDGRIRRLLQYHGAGTGRFAGRLFNAHNMPRGLVRINHNGRVQPPNPEAVAAAITTGSLAAVDALGCFIEYGGNRVQANPIEVLASALRATIIADHGKHLLIGDWAAIEARLVLSIAGQHDKTELMASGVDVYLDMAEQIYGEEGLTKANIEKRQTGKNTVLGCGFQMGAEKFHDRYCSHQPIEFAQHVIQTYRNKWAPEVPKLWNVLGKAALAAVQYGTAQDTGYGIEYRVRDNWLVGTCMDGSELYYYRPTIGHGPMPWSTPEKPDIRMLWRYQVNSGVRHAGQGSWEASTLPGTPVARGGASGRWVKAYGGLLTENYIQHMARQLLVRALKMCKAAGLPVILHNQDEIIVEHDKPDVAALKQIMEDRPQWAIDIKLPLAVECYPPCHRYHK